MNECIFCKIIKKEIPSKIIFEDDLVIAFLDINPQKIGHTLIIPKNHYHDIDDIDNDVYMHIFKIAKDLKKKLIEKLNCTGMSLIQNNGDCQEVKHYHLHLIPSYEKENKLSVDEVYEKIMN